MNEQSNEFDIESFKGSKAVVTTYTEAKHEGIVKFALDGVVWVWNETSDHQTGIRLSRVESIAWNFEDAS